MKKILILICILNNLIVNAQVIQSYSSDRYPGQEFVGFYYKEERPVEYFIIENSFDNNQITYGMRDNSFPNARKNIISSRDYNFIKDYLEKYLNRMSVNYKNASCASCENHEVQIAIHNKTQRCEFTFNVGDYVKLRLFLAEFSLWLRDTNQVSLGCREAIIQQLEKFRHGVLFTDLLLQKEKP